MNNFGSYITPAQAYAQDAAVNHCPQITLAEYEERARQPEQRCQCGQENVWRLVGAGLCFSCTTGEADASDDYELLTLGVEEHRS